MFRKDPAILQTAIDRLTKYQYMADFGTCAVSLAAPGAVGEGHPRGEDAGAVKRIDTVTQRDA